MAYRTYQTTWFLNWAIILVGSFSTSAHAFIAPVGQVLRVQPKALSESNAFTVNGHIDVSGQKVSYQLNWHKPDVYSVTLNNVPESFLSPSRKLSTWTFQREKKICRLKIGTLIAPCEERTPWAALELGGSIDGALQSFVRFQLITSADTAFRETNINEVKASSINPRLHLVIGENGSQPLALLETIPPLAKSLETSNEKALPYAQLDQTFFSIHRLSYQSGSQSDFRYRFTNSFYQLD